VSERELLVTWEALAQYVENGECSLNEEIIASSALETARELLARLDAIVASTVED